MKSQLSSIYLHCRNPLLFSLAIITFGVSGFNQYLEQKTQNTNYEPWKISNVISGDTIAVKRSNETKTIKLCGIVASRTEAKDYLQSIIDETNGIIYLEKVNNSYEAWVLLDSEVDRQIHFNTFLVENKMATLGNHSDCLSAENLELALDL